MASPSEKLAASLEALHRLQEDGVIAIRSRDLTRTHRERLTANGFLQQVFKGWYIPSRPDEPAGESTAWYTSFWQFCAAYLTERFDEAWCLSPEQSLLLHVGNHTVPRQLLVRASKGRNHVTALPHATSLLDVKARIPAEKDIVILDGLRLFSAPTALIAASPGFYERQPTDAQSALAMLRDASDVLDKLLEGGHSVIAGRLAGGLRHIGRDKIADNIIKAMAAADYKIRETNPFDEMPRVALSGRERSPYVNRLQLKWLKMRSSVIDVFPAAPGLPRGKATFLKHIDEAYQADAYHSLSIEGYRASPDLIERVRSGNWNPDAIEADRNHRDALAARGYWQAFQAVKRSVEKVLNRENAGTVADDDHGEWYREMFGPSVTAGLLRPADLAGYRNMPVYIRRSKHVPPSADAVRDLMPVFFSLLQEEEHPAVRVVLGHFFFVNIHPYVDGNGRIGRFLMNVMLASGGYPWTVIPLDRRDDYMAALEAASVDDDMTPLAKFLAQLVGDALKGKPVPAVPSS